MSGRKQAARERPSSGSKANKRPKGRSRRDSSSSSSSEEEEDDHHLYRWVGRPFVSERSEKAYTKVSLNNATYAVGDSVYVEVEGHKDFQPLLLKELWEDAQGEMMAYGTWYYVTWELGKGKPRGSLTNEFFESDRGDEVPALSIRSKIPVYTDIDDMAEDDEEAFLCRNFFDPITRSVRPRPSLVRKADPSSGKKEKVAGDGEGAKNSQTSTTTTRRTSGRLRGREQLSRRGSSRNVEVARSGDSDEEAEEDDDDGSQTGEVTEDSGGDVYDRARRKLQLSAVPDTMSCRETERERIKGFLESAISRGGSQLALYISGMPGTGKTATFYEVIRMLSAQQRKGKLPRFRFVEVNGLKLPNPEETYSVLAKLILNDSSLKLSAAKACQALEAHFSSHDPKREVCVLLIDEIDQLVTKKQQLLYNIFDWPQRPHAGLVVVGIANTMDLPERLLPRIQSRLGEGRVMFAPYNRTQIEKIVEQRLQGIELFDPNAIGFTARKVAGLSGDVRRALQLCRRAVDMCKRNGQAKVTIEHINAAVKEIDSKLHCQALGSLNPLEKLFLICTHKHAKAVGDDELTYFQDVYRRIKNTVALLPELGVVINHPAATRALYVMLMNKLVNLGLLRSDPEANVRSLGPSLALTFDYDDMRIAIGADQLLERVV